MDLQAPTIKIHTSDECTNDKDNNVTEDSRETFTSNPVFMKLFRTNSILTLSKIVNFILTMKYEIPIYSCLLMSKFFDKFFPKL